MGSRNEPLAAEREEAVRDSSKHKCLWCGAEFEPYRSNQKFCPGGEHKALYERRMRELVASADINRPGKVPAASALAIRRNGFTTPAQRREHSRLMNEVKRRKKLVSKFELDVALFLKDAAKKIEQGFLSVDHFDATPENGGMQINMSKREVQ